MLFNNAEMDRIIEGTNIDKSTVKRYRYKIGKYSDEPKTKGEKKQLEWIEAVPSFMYDLRDIISYLNEHCNNETKRQVAFNLKSYFYVDIIKRS